MDTHDSFFAGLFDRLVMELDIINEGTRDVLTLTGLCIDAVRRTITLLKNRVMENGFVSDEDEIRFFKSVKPMFYSLLVYYGKIYELELNRPIGSREVEIDYLKREAFKLYYFFEKHKDFYHYHRSGSNYMDSKYFMRNSENIISSVGAYGMDTDANFTTGQDFIVSKIAANEKLRKYIENELQLLQPTNTALGISSSTELNINLVWTASKASLVELLYGLQNIGAFNNGSADLQQVAAFFERSFNVKLGNYYRAFQEIRIRKKNRTQFLDDVRKKLLDKMDFLDENPKY